MTDIVFEPLNDIAECENCEQAPCECCNDCECYPCKCCNGCGYLVDDCTCCCECGEPGYDCTCCGDCGEHECVCGIHGSSKQAPWVTRGDKVERTNRLALSWENVWPEVDVTIDPVQKAADFYLLEAIHSRIVFSYEPISLVRNRSKDEEMLNILGVTDAKKRALFLREQRQQIRKLKQSPRYVLAQLEQTALRMQEALITTLDTVFVAYTHMAIAGEVRHHRAIGGRELPECRDSAWAGWRDIYESVGVQAILDVRDLFLEMDDGSYGGEPWANAAYVLYQREKGLFGPTELSNAKIFVDRIFSIEHNGGALLDKVEWARNNPKGWGVGEIKKALDAHASNPPDLVLLARIASRPVNNLFMQYLKAGVGNSNNREITDWIELLDKEPVYRCRVCNSDAMRGHGIRCLNRRTIVEGEDILNAGDFSVRWSKDEVLDQYFHKESYPVNPDFSINLSYEGSVVLDISIHSSGYNDCKTFNLPIQELLNLSLTDIIEDMRRFKESPYANVYVERFGYTFGHVRMDPQDTVMYDSIIKRLLLRGEIGSV